MDPGTLNLFKPSPKSARPALLPGAVNAINSSGVPSLGAQPRLALLPGVRPDPVRFEREWKVQGAYNKLHVQLAEAITG